jgi:hypothetical protein
MQSIAADRLLRCKRRDQSAQIPLLAGVLSLKFEAVMCNFAMVAINHYDGIG